MQFIKKLNIFNYRKRASGIDIGEIFPVLNLSFSNMLGNLINENKQIFKGL